MTLGMHRDRFFPDSGIMSGDCKYQLLPVRSEQHPRNAICFQNLYHQMCDSDLVWNPFLSSHYPQLQQIYMDIYVYLTPYVFPEFRIHSVSRMDLSAWKDSALFRILQ